VRRETNAVGKRFLAIIHKEEFVIYNETGIDISLTVAYHDKLHHQNKKNNNCITSGVIVFVDINH